MSQNNIQSRKPSSEEIERQIHMEIKCYTNQKKQEFREEARKQELNRKFSVRRNSISGLNTSNKELDNSLESPQQLLNIKAGSQTRYLKTFSQGGLEINCKNNKLCSINWVEKQTFPDVETTPNLLITKVYNELQEYFSGDRREFSITLEDIDFENQTDFQILVQKELLKIPYGQVISYKKLAENLGNPKSIRAAASACGANSISVIIPCHRVLGSDNSLTGFRGGLSRKQKLLELEGIKH